GHFDLDDYIDYIIEIVDVFGGDVHLVAVCQPAVPVFAATALLESADSPFMPKSITLMGGPIDTRENPTEVNLYAAKHTLDWFRHNVIMTVPFPYAGVMRRVYPGFLQLTGFMTMNLDRHMNAHYEYFDHLVNGDGDSAEKHREFYDEYMSVMDLTEEFYLQTVDTVFLKKALPLGTMIHRDTPVDPSAIRRTPIFTVEGEKDDISGLGQTRAAHTLTPNLPDDRHQHYEQANVGHYGVFNGSRYRRHIAPRITDFVARWEDRDGAATTLANAATMPPREEPLLAVPAAAGADASAEGTQAKPEPADDSAPIVVAKTADPVKESATNGDTTTASTTLNGAKRNVADAAAIAQTTAAPATKAAKKPPAKPRQTKRATTRTPKPAAVADPKDADPVAPESAKKPAPRKRARRRPTPPSS
ncbi:MAG: polyhydroxyalkanoate depolymerase, partial [Pseudomonadota bacterium]